MLSVKRFNSLPYTSWFHDKWSALKKWRRTTPEADRHKLLLKYANVQRAVFNLEEFPVILDWLDSRIFDNFELMRQSARDDKAYYIGYYSGRMDEAEEIKLSLENSDKDIARLEERYKNK